MEPPGVRRKIAAAAQGARAALRARFVLSVRQEDAATAWRSGRAEFQSSLWDIGVPLQISRRPSSAFDMVTSSVYSISEPTGMPIAMRLVLTPRGLSRRDR